MAFERVAELLELDDQIRQLKERRAALAEELRSDPEVKRALEVLGAARDLEATAPMDGPKGLDSDSEEIQRVGQSDLRIAGVLVAGSVPDRVLGCLRRASGAQVSRVEIARELGIELRVLGPALKRLADRGHVERTGRGLWRAL